ncbi:MAG: anthranilate synthase [Pseudohongiellaceae bacterium]|jgi:anthranilate synthase
MQLIQKQTQYRCASGINIRRSSVELDYDTAMVNLANSLNSQKGVLLASSFEYPGRYTRWDIGFVNPPIQITAHGREMRIDALNTRGNILLPEIYRAIENCSAIAELNVSKESLSLIVKTGSMPESEELRSRQPSVFSVLRELINCFHSAKDPYLGLYGALGYDLTFQFEDVLRYQAREESDRDLVLYLPDQILVSDHRGEITQSHSYDFVCCSWESPKRTETTGGFKRVGISRPFTPAASVSVSCDHMEGEFAAQVKRAKEHFMRGDLFEVVPGQTFYEPCADSPAELFHRLKERNPAPYGALMNLGEQEYLVAASPEMFVRVDGKQIETCPISGTIKRGVDAIADAEQIKKLLNSHKDESELSMCTDVDRNDKARVCEAGSVKVVGRRQIEMYSRLIHTVDHVKGVLKPEFDALDGFLAHTWAVTVTGAPKLSAMQFIEQNEKSPRRWYGGAIGHLGFDGNINTGLTLRTVRIAQGVAEVRAGATLLIDSDPEDEEAETRLKASALIDAIRGGAGQKKSDGSAYCSEVGAGLRGVMVDHQDSFVHNLAAYFRQCAVELITLRPDAAREYLKINEVDFVVLSPGPFNPSHFNMAATIELLVEKKLPVFGVCLGLQGIVEYFGGSLEALDYPMHGKPSSVNHSHSSLFKGLESPFTAGRYHSLVAASMPDCLQVTARTDDGKVMAVEHTDLPIKAVQFHPESIMTLGDQAGYKLIENVVLGFKLGS